MPGKCAELYLYAVSLGVCVYEYVELKGLQVSAKERSCLKYQIWKHLQML